MAAMAAVKLDSVIASSVDLAREAADRSSHVFGVGEHLGCEAEADRVATHYFACTHPGYPGWRWAVTLARASRGKVATVDEVVMVPGPDAVLAPAWVPWAERIETGDITPGMLMPTPDGDRRLTPGYTGGEGQAASDPAEASEVRAVVAELGLGRERLLSDEGRAETAERWLDGDGGPDNAMTRQAPGVCATCGYFVRLSGSLGTIFGACANQYGPADGRVVSCDHGCGAHSDVAEPAGQADRSAPVWDTLSIDQSLFD